MTGSQISSTASDSQHPQHAARARDLRERLLCKKPGNLDGELREELLDFLQTSSAPAPCDLPHHDLLDDRFRRIFVHAPLGMSLVDDNGLILEVNESLLNMFGLERDDYIGKPSFDFIHPEFLERKEHFVKQLMAGEIDSYELVEKRLNAEGRELWIRVTSTRIYDPLKGHHVRLNMVENIHDAKAAEDASAAAQKKLQDVADAIPGGVYEYCLHSDGRHELRFANKGFGHIFEIPAEELLGDAEKVFDCIVPEDRESLKRSIQVSADAMTPWVMELRIITPNGRRKWLAAESLPQRCESGSVCWHGMVTDITGRKATEAELRNAKEQAEQAARAKSEFLTNISHEIRTPMNAVLGFSELLATELRDPIHRQYLQSIRSAGSTLLHLINDFLDLSRIEAGKITLHREAISLPDLLDDIRRLFLIKTNEKGLEFWTHIDGRLPQFVVADETRLRQVLFNLVGNAVKFTRQGYVGVKIRRVRRDVEENTVDLALIVEDTGVGIGAEDQSRIFDSFEQQRGQSREFGGTGLGLAICRRIVEAMGGEISLDSEPERGSTFTVTLRDLTIAEESETLGAAGGDSPRVVRFKSGQVLVIDDNDANRTLLRGYLGDTGLEVREATNSEEALRAIKTRRPDLLLLDVRMPGAEGLHLDRDLRTSLTRACAKIPVIVLTANPEAQNSPALQKLNVQGVLLKPVSRRELVGLLSAVIPAELHDDTTGEPSEETAEETQLDWRRMLQAPGSRTLPDPAREELERIVRDQLPELMSAPDVDDVQTLALNLLSIADQNDLPVLRRYAEQLSEAIAVFDVAVMSRLISELPEFLSP